MKYKSSGSKLSYVHDLTLALGDDTITSSTWVLDSGITNVSDTNTVTSATITVSGGTNGTTYKLRHSVDTAGGLKHVKDFYVKVQDQRAGD